MRTHVSAAIAALGVMLTAGVSDAGAFTVTSYTDRTAFEAALAPGAYVEPAIYANYGSIYSPAGPGVSPKNGDYAYSIYAPNAYNVNGDLSVGRGERSFPQLCFSFVPGIRAFGAYFYNNDEAGVFSSARSFQFQIQLFSPNVGAPLTAYAANHTAASDKAFIGFIADGDFVNAAVTAESPDYATVGGVIVGAPLPVPAPLPLLGGLTAWAWTRRLRRRLTPQRPPGARCAQR